MQQAQRNLGPKLGYIPLSGSFNLGQHANNRLAVHSMHGGKAQSCPDIKSPTQAYNLAHTPGISFSDWRKKRETNHRP